MMFSFELFFAFIYSRNIDSPPSVLQKLIIPHIHNFCTVHQQSAVTTRIKYEAV